MIFNLFSNLNFSKTTWVFITITIFYIIFRNFMSEEFTEIDSIENKSMENNSTEDSMVNDQIETDSIETDSKETDLMENFSENNKKIKIYNFNTEWCGYSKRFQPTWDKFEKNNKNKKIDIVDVKCDDDKNKVLCEKYEIPGFPSVIADTGKHVVEYNGDRSYEDLIKFSASLESSS